MFRRAPSSATPGTGAESRVLWILNGLPHTTGREVEQWLDALAELSLDEWIRVAERCAVVEYTALPMTRACERIERVIAEQGLEFTAWLVRDLVYSASYPVRRAGMRQPGRMRARIAVARMAAEWAALAKTCRPWLSPTDHDLACAPFAEPFPRRDSAAV
ncbi:MAG TPA: hypothetical protein VLN49_06490 [Gemmatimonadaceae bacterium]|nr:hypothetical protein [Gemmatimonadaceae bacterium]